MTLLYIDSFDHYTTITDKWDAAISTAPTCSSSAARFGAGGFFVNISTNAISAAQRRFTTSTPTTVYVGFAMRIDNMTSGGFNKALVALSEGLATSHVDLRLDGNNKLYVTRNGTTLGNAYGTALSFDTWYYIELKVVIHDTAGSVEMRINEAVETITWVTGTSTTQDTRNGGSGYVDTITIGTMATTGSGGAYIVHFDDLYILDTNGSNNTYLGDVRVQANLPAGNGNSSQLVGSDGNSTDNYLLVDEAAPSTADYVESLTSGDKDTYVMGDLTPTSGVVYGVQTAIYAAKTDAGARAIKSVARLSGVETDGASFSLSVTYQYDVDMRETKPGGGAWSISDVNNVEIGAKVA